MTDTRNTLPVLEVVSTAWDKVSGAKGTIWGVMILSFLIIFGLNIFRGITFSLLGATIVGSIIIVLIQLAGMAVQLLFSWGLTYIGIQRALNLPIQVSSVRYVFDLKLFLKMIGLYLLQFLIVLGVLIPGLILSWLFLKISGVPLHQTAPAVIPGTVWLGMSLISFITFILICYLALRMVLAKGIVIKNNLDPLDAIKQSFNATDGVTLKILGLYIINAIILIVSAIPFGIGLIWSIPYLTIAYGVLFDKLIVNRQQLVAATV